MKARVLIFCLAFGAMAARAYWASPAPATPGIVVAPTFAPTLTLTHLPIDLILPRAITR